MKLGFFCTKIIAKFCNTQEKGKIRDETNFLHQNHCKILHYSKKKEKDRG
jgi:hypothetical protein